MWICALPEVHKVSHLSRWAAVYLLLLVILTTTALLHRWIAADGGSSVGVCTSPKAQRMPHVSRWAAVIHVLLMCLFKHHCGTGGEYSFVNCVHASS